jgi:hypothetical protein
VLILGGTGRIGRAADARTLVPLACKAVSTVMISAKARGTAATVQETLRDLVSSRSWQDRARE